MKYIAFSITVLCATLVLLSWRGANNANSANSANSANTATNNPANSVPAQNESIQNVTIPPLPKSATFCSEKVPLENFDVRESLTRELFSIMYAHSSTTYILQLQGRFKEMIIKMLEKEGIPADIYYLCVAESMLQPLASPAGAKGYWQFTDATAKSFGLFVNREVDERYNWEKATAAACRYLKKGYEKYGNWTLAAASYNIGFANVDKRVAEQGTTNYYNMQFPQETARYVYRALAYREILENPAKFGFNIAKEHLCKPIKCKSVKVSGSVANWSTFAKEHGTNFKMLKMSNEWIRSSKLVNAERRTYNVLVPLPDARTNY